jgi:hypothetical protein
MTISFTDAARGATHGSSSCRARVRAFFEGSETLDCFVAPRGGFSCGAKTVRVSLSWVTC